MALLMSVKDNIFKQNNEKVIDVSSGFSSIQS